ncbi:hypothetical protein [Lysinibacillus sp. FSL K6-3209]|uniref:hypothetical protein n=1 Tax=Lysinibacillus sp. FSL K6-3209 TaxID=2921497 RepID=UPI0030D89AF6
MDALTNLNNQIEREILCIDDLTEEIKMHARKGQTDILKQLERDLHNSLQQLEKLHEKKGFWATVATLNKNGKLQKAVNEVVEMA